MWPQGLDSGVLVRETTYNKRVSVNNDVPHLHSQVPSAKPLGFVAVLHSLARLLLSRRRAYSGWRETRDVRPGPRYRARRAREPRSMRVAAGRHLGVS